MKEVLIGAMLCALIVFVILAAWRPQVTGIEEAPMPRTRIDDWNVYTVEHDGHKYVIARYTQCVAMLHSPNCGCKEAK